MAHYRDTSLNDVLGPIYHALQNHRGFDNFVRSKKLPRVDFFIPGRSLIIEFDESQHFTKPRYVALHLPLVWVFAEPVAYVMSTTRQTR